MQPERDAAAAATPPGDGTRTNVQTAIEQFIELHSTGQRLDPAAFAARYPVEVRPAILAQCREFLAFDGLLGHQEWTPTPAKETHGRAFGDFVIQEELGRGGMGVVYLAHQKSLNRRVALKVMASGLTLSKRHVERFRREAAATAQLRHPAIVSVHALTEVDGTFALAMDYVAGRNLADMLDDLRLANGDGATAVDGSLGIAPEKGYVAECAMFCAALASALAVAHQANVVHRDLKPRNLMLDDRRQVRLLDFGLAKSLGEGSISMSGEITGTAHYMSPEQTLAKRVEVDHRADIWALGVILYEMLTLRRPFDGKNLQQVVYQICFQEPVSPQRLNHKVPRDLVTICQKALEKDPQKRYQSAAEFEADLQRFLRWEPVHAKPASAWTRVSKWTRRHRMETAIASALALAGLGALGSQWYQGRRADELLARAAVAKQQDHLEAALALVNQALALRNDEHARLLLSVYSSDRESTVAQANAAARESQSLIDRNRELAIRLAVQAEQRHSSLVTRSAVLDALGSGSVTRVLRTDEARPTNYFHLAWSPDGSRCATVGARGHAALWDPAAGARLTLLRGHDEKVVVIGALFAGAERLVTVGNDMTLRTWRVTDGAPERTVALPGLVFGMHGSRGGARALVVTYGTGAGPHQARVFDTATGEAVSPVVPHADRIVRLALSPGGTFAATATDQVVRLWSVADGKPIGEVEANRFVHVRAIAFAPDDAQLAIAGDENIVVVRTSDGATVARARHSLGVRCLAFDSQGRRLVTGSADRTARVWQPAADGGGALVEVATLTGHSGPVAHVAFDASDQLVLTGTVDGGGDLSVFDVGDSRETSATLVHRYEAGASIGFAEFAPGGRSVLALAGTQRALVWDFAETRGVVTMRQNGWAGACAFAAGGKQLATGGTDGCLRAWSATDGSLRWTSKPFKNPQTLLAIDDAGECLASSGLHDSSVHVVRVADGEWLYDLPDDQGGVSALRFQPGGNRLLVAAERTVSLWNTNDRSRVLRRQLPLPIASADLQRDGVLATVERDEAIVRLWRAPYETPSGEIRTGAAVAAIRFAPDGQSLLAACRNGEAVVHRLDGERVMTLRRTQPLRTAAWSRDGRFVLTCGEGADAETLVWRVDDGSELLRFSGHRHQVEDGAFHPDGSAVATCSRDGTICIWPTDPVAVARRLLPASPPAPGTTK